MKKFTFMLIALLCAVVTFAAGPKRQFNAFAQVPVKQQLQIGSKMNAKQAPQSLVKKVMKTAKARAPKKVVAATDLVGDYQWDYLQSSETSTDIESLTTNPGSSHVTIAESTTTEGGITISGMFTNDLEATVVSDDEDGDYFVIEGGQLAGTSSYGNYLIYGLYYYEGDEENEAGWYYSNIYGDLLEDGSFEITPWLVRVLSGGQYDGYSLTPYYVEGSTLTPAEPLTAITLPEGVEAMPYVMTYDGGSTPVNVAVDGNDVYFQGMSSYIPEAWVKGTKNGNTVTFPAMQYMGEYGSYGSSYFFYNGETVFTYDAEADTYSASGQVFGVLADRYYDGNYTNPVIKPVVEKAATPANPEITALKNGDYGWYFDFNVPLVDTNGEPLLASKLSYMIYTDIEGEIAPLTFTPDTHTKLAEDMTEIPYGFTEGYDFYDTEIYLNELYSADWNNLGIQSIYRGGGEENATEIQWYHIKDYAGPAEATFDFNAMDVATSSNGITDGDITEALTLTEGDVTLTISPKAEGTSTPNRFWSTNAGPQLRVYSGTLTFEVPAGLNITQIVFNEAKWNDGNAADSGEFDGTTWTGEAQKVIVTIAANTQINSIVVTYLSEGGEEQEDVLVTLPEGVEPVEYTLSLEGATSQGTISTESTKLVAFDGDDVYVQGLAYYFKDAYVKGTRNAQGQYAFKSGQLVGEDEYGKEYLVGVSVDAESNFVYEPEFVFDFDAQTGTLSLVEGTYYGESGTKDQPDLWDYFESAVYTVGALVLPDAVEAPEDLATETYLFKATSLEYDEEAEEDAEPEFVEYSTQVEVGFDGNDAYIQGLAADCPELWVKATKNESGQYVIPANQYMGTYDVGGFGWFIYDYYFTAVDEEGNLVDVVLNYNAETNTFSTDQLLALNGDRKILYYYQLFQDVTITKMNDFAATPADPSVKAFTPTGSYPSVQFDIPAKDVDGNDLLGSKLFYTIWIEKDGTAQPLTLAAADYDALEEDMTEIPYTFGDDYDIYARGTRVYLNQSAEEIATWTKIGVQSIYRGGGEENKSNTVWFDASATGIANVNTANNAAVYFDLQGRMADAAQKGLLIKQTRNADGTVKTVKVVRK